MKKWMKAALLFCIIALNGGLAAHDTHNTLAPIARVYLAPTMGEYGAFSFMGEAGNKNFRGNGTYGVNFSPCQRFKVSGEYLTQELKYDFSRGDTRKWVSQYGLGTAYQYQFKSTPFQSLDLRVAYEHAFFRHLGTKHFNEGGALKEVKRRIAGSDGVLSSLGTSLKLWNCGFLSAALNYDFVKYHRHYKSDVEAKGFGGSVGFSQYLSKEVSLSLDAEVRRPFNFYQGALNWIRAFSWGKFNLGFFGNYTAGKKGNLPDVTVAGVQMGFSFGGVSKCCRISPAEVKSKKLPQNSPITNSFQKSCQMQEYCDLAAWVAKPAVYVPMVLAIADEKTVTVVAACIPPTSTTIPDQQFFGAIGDPYSFDTAPFFSSNSPLAFSATGLPAGSSINPTTGVISGVIVDEMLNPFNFTVTATSSCGSTSQSFVVEYFNIS